MDRRRSGSELNRLVLTVFGVCLFASTSGCSSVGSLYRDVVGGEPDEQAAGVVDVYYTADQGVKLYGEPRFGGTAIATLPVHQKLYRSKQERGFAYVKVDGSGQTGWVDNSRLIWRLPSRKPKPAAPSAPAAVASPPVAEVAETEPAAVVPEVPANVPVAADEPEPAPTEDVNPSRFDPF